MLFYTFSGNFKNLESGYIFIKRYFKYMIVTNNLDFENYIDYLKLFLYIITNPARIAYNIYTHELFSYIEEFLEKTGTAITITSSFPINHKSTGVFNPVEDFTLALIYSSTTLIPTTLYLTVLSFLVIIVKPLFQILCYGLENIREKREEYPIFTMLGYFLVVLIFIFWIIFKK
jgi:hypothetical protein